MSDAESGSRGPYVRLCCALVGGNVFFVDIGGNRLIYDLKKAIKSEMPVTLSRVDAARLDLYLTKVTEDSGWLKASDKAERAELEAAINSEGEHGEAVLEPTEAWLDTQTVFKDAPGEDVIHVLVKVRPRELVEETKDDDDEVMESTAKRQRVVWDWKEKEEKPKYFLEKCTMFFVNRDRATQQLRDIHRRKYYRAVSNIGMEWEIPIVDNVFGLGKSTFSDEYIRQCRDVWPPETDADGEDFMPVLRACHTIHIVFKRKDLIREDHFESKMIKRICRFFDRKFGTRPRALDQKLVETMESSDELLENLTDEVGPLFIVLDEIGLAFEGPRRGGDDLTKREQFLEFCRSALLNWLPMPKVFFLIAGRASFLSYADTGPVTPTDVSPVRLRRLSLQLLRPKPIEQIIYNTLVDAEKKSIKEHCRLDNEQVTEVAAHLFKTTFGHPRSLIAAFRECHSYDDLIEYDVSDQPDCIDWVAFAERMQSYAEPLEEMMSSALKSKPVNLARVWTDKGKRAISYDSIVSSFGIGWEGTMQNATLYMPSYLQQLILAHLYPLREYLDKVANCQVSLDYSTVFEWVCLKRFQELFAEESQKYPHQVLPGFFTDQQQFGRCAGVQFAKCTRRTPKITERSSSELSLDAPTASPEEWPILLNEIDRILADECRLNLKPRPKSASPNALLITMVQTTKLTVGLAVKNYTRGSSFGETQLKDECKLFNRMFTASRDRLNVLIVCSTIYSGDLNKRFDSTESKGHNIVRDSAVYSAHDFANIDEVILLNLSTPEQRAKFFGIQDIQDEARQTALESVMEKSGVEF